MIQLIKKILVPVSIMAIINVIFSVVPSFFEITGDWREVLVSSRLGVNSFTSVAAFVAVFWFWHRKLYFKSYMYGAASITYGVSAAIIGFYYISNTWGLTLTIVPLFTSVILAFLSVAAVFMGRTLSSGMPIPPPNYKPWLARWSGRVDLFESTMLLTLIGCLALTYWFSSFLCGLFIK